MQFEDVMQSAQWSPIRNCPGRYVLQQSKPNLTIDGLLGKNTHYKEYTSRLAKDTICIVRFEQGGIISYRRKNDTWLHTLNTEEGFMRKVKQLELFGIS